MILMKILQCCVGPPGASLKLSGSARLDTVCAHSFLFLAQSQFVDSTDHW